MTTAEPLERKHAFTKAIYWVQAIGFQGARVIEAHEQDNSSTTAGSARLEEQFFLNACEKAVRWVDVLRRDGQDEELRAFLPTGALRQFIRTMESKDIRNLREHEEEYLRTGGKSLKDEIVDASHPEGGPTILVEPGVTILRDGQIIIGGRLNIQEVIQTAQTLNAALVPAQHAYVRATRPRLKDANPQDYPYMFAPTKII